MKRFLLLLAALMLMMTFAIAEEEATVVPVQIIPQAEDMLYMSDAIAKANEALEVLPDNCLTRAELVQMSDGSHRWVVSIFDLTNYTDAWCIEVDALSGEVLQKTTTSYGFFVDMYARWEQAKGINALWSLEDKMLYDTLYSIQPMYSLPLETDMTHGEALEKAIAALEMTNAAEYKIGYGYMMGIGEGEVNGVWEVYFVQNDEMVYKVNLDAVTGEIYFIEPDAEENG
ncbi:MAG: PepSY domain-containing protein [Clostridia bacterium]|nr:PepSY domain-containing protein [Clostridia bacterium]